MSVDYQAEVLQAMENIRDYQDKAFALQQELLKSTVSVRSKDRTITVKLGARGDIRGITFHSNAHQSVPAAELGSVLTELINRGRTQAQEKVKKAMASLGDFGTLMSGATAPEVGGELGELMAALRGAVRTEPPAPPTTHKKQEQFHG